MDFSSTSFTKFLPDTMTMDTTPFWYKHYHFVTDKIYATGLHRTLYIITYYMQQACIVLEH